MNVCKKILMPFLFAIMLSSCTSTDKISPDAPQSKLFNDGVSEMNNGNYASAIKNFEYIDLNYPFGIYYDQVQLNLIFSYYQNSQYNLADAQILKYEQLSPESPHSDWVLYMQGLNYQALNTNYVQYLFNVDNSDRTDQYKMKAFFAYKKLLTLYPNSLYARDAQLRMIFIKNQLAQHEYSIANYYNQKGAWISSINRAKKIQILYSDTKSAKEAINFQIQGYDKLNLNSQKKEYQKLKQLNEIKS
ncbi:outer membrane protein assembly factor BamD [Paraphotobacterium marinum]|uniref:Outer membrane protein assembly factor BamD n=1 Tax=Paraphotobacterium marinum TaxID=1755811 RepID=A0A220VCD5_9GAMM|nr:outer membrane protein assembly factor BamD [Paraphotobacterium marinum]ASK77842.1 outer membrane protein assembly factor BamD [Paraphotobacterium marinum]